MPDKDRSLLFPNVKDTLEMPTSPNETLARDISREQIGNTSPSVSPTHQKSWRLCGAACIAIALVAAFAQPLLILIRYAAGSELYSYILLVPFVSVYLLYLRRDQLPKTYGKDLPLGTLFLIAGLGVLACTYWLDVTGRTLSLNNRIMLLTFSFLCCFAASGFFLVGRRWMRAAAFPLTFLIFMAPMPDAMADALETASKYASAEVANVLFHFSGTPFVRDGLMFQLPNITIEVAQQCSGIRSSWVLFMTSILAANLLLKTPWRRFALVVLVIPLAILRNGFRILAIGLLCVNVGPQMINSLIHRRGGPLFFVVSLIPLFALLWWLYRGESRSRQQKST